MLKNLVSLAIAILLLAGVAPVWAQDPATTHQDMGAMNHDAGGMDHGAMSMQGGTAPADARDPHAYAGGEDFGPIPRPRMGDEERFGMLMIDRLEAARSDDNTAAMYEVQGRFGGDYDRAVLKAEGESDGGALQEARTELLWGHAIASYWDTQVGVRHDSGMGPGRNWLAFGVQGLAPYWFELDIAAYLGESGRSALRLDAEYELLLTQKLILQPRVEANVYGKRDTEREIGSGLSDLSAGLRLRYEIRREFAPYVGVEWAGKYGATADHARAAGEDAKEARIVAGLRVWY
ncbi:MAG: copper resistance protein B [Gammaproteobacteria bacterium]|nr:copper resistance protein B [Gammaproteobacteria bacterium]